MKRKLAAVFVVAAFAAVGIARNLDSEEQHDSAMRHAATS